MASNIVKKSIQIDAGDTLRTVRSLKQEISDLRDELLNLEKGTEEYDEAQKKLQEDVEDLNEVMGAHKDKAKDLEGSYNALQNELKELKQAWKETNDEAERDVLGQKINELNNQLKEMDASIGDFHRNVGNYESAWNGLTGVMENGEKITDDLEKGIMAFGTALGMSDKQVNALSKSLKAMKDGFNIAKDIAKAREETAKLGTAEKVAAAEGTALATSQKATATAAKTMATGEVAAATATKGLSVAMKGLKAALVSTGIGALIVLVGELIAQLDKLRIKIQSSKDAALVASARIAQNEADRIQTELENTSRSIEAGYNHQVDMAKAAGADERKILEQRLENYKKLYQKVGDLYEEAKTKEKEYNKEVEGYSKRQRNRLEKEINDTKAANKAASDAAIALRNEYFEGIRDTMWAIEVYDEEQKHIKNTTDELRKWSDLVKDPKFQASWKALFQTDFQAASPIETLKAQMEAATRLVTKFKGDTSEVERYFQQLISEAEAEWKSLADKEQEIFDEKLTPAQRLENEKADWVAKAEKWGMDATNIVKYYDNKIQEEIDKAEKERQAKEEAANAQRLQEIEDYLSMVDAALATQEKMDALFNPMFTQDTARGDIDQEAEALQRLYDTQMEYLNGLLESADLTEEAYAGIEERILSLTVAFNSQMNVLKKEQDYQGKNWALLSRKGVASFQLMEDAAADFASSFQAIGLENSVAFKAFATAQAIISSLLAATRVLAEEPGPFALKIAASIAAGVAGMANVAAIWGVNADGSNAGSMMNTQVSQAATPVIGNSQPINYTRNITSAEEEDQMNQPIYVTVTDIEDGINGRRAQVDNSSF